MVGVGPVLEVNVEKGKVFVLDYYYQKVLVDFGGNDNGIIHLQKNFKVTDSK
jgi:hypothetical protein